MAGPWEYWASARAERGIHANDGAASSTVAGHRTFVILAVDLASRRFRDYGVALLEESTGRPSLEFVLPESLGLVGVPDAQAFAEAMCVLVDRRTER